VVQPIRLAVVVLAMTFLAPGVARAEEWIFFDPHPVHPAVGGGFCEMTGAHVHDYAAVDPGAFVRRDGLWFFVGDPVPYGYRGTVYRFEGSHEIAGSEGFAACTRAGVHYHLYPPAMVVSADDALYLTPVVAPFWWDDRPRRRVEPRRPHAFPVEVRDVRPAPPAIGPPAARPRGARVLDPPRRAPAPPPPPAARPSSRGR